MMAVPSLHVRRAASLLAGCLVAAAPAPADLLVAVVGTDVIEIDTDTLAVKTVGLHGFQSIGGMAYDRQDLLFAVDTVADVLIAIDPSTGVGTLIGSLGIPVTFSTGMADDPTADVLYGVAKGGSGFSSFLVTYDKATGAASSIADTDADAIVGLSFDESGQLWGLDGAREELIRVDKATGASIPIGTGALGAHPNIGGFEIGASGTFWAVENTASTYRLLLIDAGTGAPTVVGTLSGIAGSLPLTGLTSAGKGTPLGTTYCSPATHNSTGGPAVLTATGSPVASHDNLVLTAGGLPQNQVGYFLNSQVQGLVMNPGGSQGNLCVVGAVGRYKEQAGSSGVDGTLRLALDLPHTPTPGGRTAILAGQTWNFQCWFHDMNPGPTSNFTDAVSITFR